VATLTRRRRDVGGRQVPWGRFIPGDCACDAQAPCLLHYADLDWQGRAAALDRAGVKAPIGR
jgi:hypothetical protein